MQRRGRIRCASPRRASSVLLYSQQPSGLTLALQ
jgi:hypothetical protein